MTRSCLPELVEQAPLDPGGQSGYTLVELLMVVIVLASLVGTVLAGVANLSSEADVNACKAERAAVRAAVVAGVGTNSATDTWSNHIDGGSSAVKWFTVNGTTVVAVPGAPCS